MPVDAMAPIPENRPAATTTTANTTSDTPLNPSTSRHSASSSIDSNASSTANHDTGFPEPFSLERNTTLKHPDAISDPDADMATLIISSKHHKRVPHPHLNKHPHLLKKRENGMGAGEGDGVFGEEGEGEMPEEKKEGKLKKVVHKLSCRH
ncbi:hypothetical protein BJ508DRAFT_419795 [Ascobolus immersus RN42]|uniref:Uncharacterized protein n=1 Tax=Ascobolus immersus RN42 TaxID=1160509 RepID=A0A3N4HBC5_ASCIM|nr:hypothetical protein BJ508DRAFT_419795 [Ascobolus immersus RN42]